MRGDALHILPGNSVLRALFPPRSLLNSVVYIPTYQHYQRKEWSLKPLLFTKGTLMLI